VTAIAGIVGIPQILTGLWLIGVSIALFRAGATEPAAANEGPDLS
jgi:hypothetical protein